jgi:hypothetical protein
MCACPICPWLRLLFQPQTLLGNQRVSLVWKVMAEELVAMDLIAIHARELFHPSGTQILLSLSLQLST